MTTTQKSVLGAGITIAVLALMFYAYSTRQQSLSQESDSFLPTPTGDTSPSALQQDAAAIDAELAGLDEDSVILEESLEIHSQAQTQ